MAAVLGGLPAWAAPFAGTGHAPISEKVDSLKARGQALERARRAALEAALEQVGPADAVQRKKIMDAAAVWTRAYRVLQQGDDGATATAVVSVEIDTGRLSKALALPAAPVTKEAPALVAVRGEGCAEGAAEAVAQRWIKAGLLRDGRGGTISAGSARTLELRCRELGAVAYPRGVVAEAAVVLRGEGRDGAASATATGFAPDAAAAAAAALESATNQVSSSMSVQTASGLRLRLTTPWPAARVRRVERAIAESVIGAQAVKVAGVGGDGSVILKIDGPLSAADLQERLAAVQVPGATLVALEVEGPDVVHARLQ
ncbi:hypothetical protein [Nannocystis bainbridge]|uniref:Uncharacterized protein n=1 Tax=Nannocystis bainbridge TaxID=2995303 RepID=A0ABT5DRS3_9BACT|nr:hypothetical protein [Nannocystis bainbridge]MDC0715865.1 hypothetical protein [Nannocystis bainbridge]